LPFSNGFEVYGKYLDYHKSINSFSFSTKKASPSTIIPRVVVEKLEPPSSQNLKNISLNSDSNSRQIPFGSAFEHYLCK
jgi:hypothetical protein